MSGFVEDAALEWFEGMGWQCLSGPDIGSGGSAPERASIVGSENRLALVAKDLVDHSNGGKGPWKAR